MHAAHLVVHAVRLGTTDDGDACVAGRRGGCGALQPGQGRPLGRVQQLHLYYKVLVCLRARDAQADICRAVGRLCRARRPCRVFNEPLRMQNEQNKACHVTTAFNPIWQQHRMVLFMERQLYCTDCSAVLVERSSDMLSAARTAGASLASVALKSPSAASCSTAHVAYRSSGQAKSGCLSI